MGVGGAPRPDGVFEELLQAETMISPPLSSRLSSPFVPNSRRFKNGSNWSGGIWSGEERWAHATTFSPRGPRSEVAGPSAVPVGRRSPGVFWVKPTDPGQHHQLARLWSSRLRRHSEFGIRTRQNIQTNPTKVRLAEFSLKVSVNDPIGCSGSSANARRGLRRDGTERDGGGKLSAWTAVASKINAICPIRRPTWTNDEGKKKILRNTATRQLWEFGCSAGTSEDGPDIVDVFAFVQTRTETFFLTASAGFYRLTRPNGRRLCLTDA